ncbi:MAG: TIGR01440 family protein [Ruminococcaceae bacterium]|nr:TIGR01440 family protein [Oscillospiraceae bacterium]
MLEKIKNDATAALTELLAVANLKPGDLLVIGCSSSEMVGEKIGTHSSVDAACALADTVLPLLKEAGVHLAVQCCEHLNRALIMESAVAEKFGYEPVNVVPQPKAGGSFATAVWGRMACPTAVEHIRAHAGLDIGGTLIGMHLKEVAVPVRLSVKTIGEAPLLCARTRPKFIGGARAVYDETKL